MAYEKFIMQRAPPPANVEPAKIELWRSDTGVRPPDLQTLVTERGGYNRITAEDWVVFDRDMALWKERMRLGELRIPRKRR